MFFGILIVLTFSSIGVYETCMVIVSLIYHGDTEVYTLIMVSEQQWKKVAQEGAARLEHSSEQSPRFLACH